MRKAALIGSEALWEAGRSEYHPLKPERMQRTWDLLHAYRAFDAPNSRVVAPRQATDEELAWFHTPEYVDAVKRLSHEGRGVSPRAFGFGPGDNPVSHRMYEIESLKTGGGLVAAELVLSGDVDVAFNFGGGMHHAGAARASGFCVFNDPVITIQWALKRGYRVAYIDIDAHHGDGVQEAFYHSDQVLTVSLHESGRYLFPGTGFESESGKGVGQGYAINIPLPPYTTDEPYLWAFREVVLPLVHRFEPDVVVSQLGVDAHVQDPLTHLSLTIEGIAELVEEIGALCPRWIALGGGGYDITVVPRAWTAAYGIMSEQAFPDELPASYAQRYGGGTLWDHSAPRYDESTQETVQRQIERTVERLGTSFDL